MSKTEVYERIVELCKDAFDNDEFEYTADTSFKDVPEWDSLTHLSLISDIEEDFGIKFTLDEMMNNKSLGTLSEAVINHLEN